MKIKIKTADERRFLDVLNELYYDKKLERNIGVKYIIYNIDKGWFNELADFYKLMLISFSD